MIPMKYAWSDMKSAASARNETTRLSALATGFRLIITAAPKISINKAKIQKRNGDIFLFCHPERSEGSLTSSLITLCNLCDPDFEWEIPRFVRNDRTHFFSFHLSTTPCITP